METPLGVGVTGEFPPALETRLRVLAEADDGDATMVVVDDVVLAQRPPASNPALLIIVHPGDAVPYLDDSMTRTRAAELRTIAYDNQQGMAHEIAQLLANGADCVVLHRVSSVDGLLDGNVDGDTGSVVASEYLEALSCAARQGVQLYGDDLDAASQWLLARMQVASRPLVLLTGAYAEREQGCISVIANALVHAGVDSVIVSAFSPTSDANDDPRWEPPAHRLPGCRPR